MLNKDYSAFLSPQDRILALQKDPFFFTNQTLSFAVFPSHYFFLAALPLSKAGAKVHGLSSYPNLTTMPLVLNCALSLIYRHYAKNEDRCFLLRQAIQELNLYSW